MGFGKNGTGAILRESGPVTLATLASEAAIIFSGSLAIENNFRTLKQEILASIEGLTAGEGNGLILGIANGELSVTEIAEAMAVNGPLDRNDRAAAEQAERVVKVLGGFAPNSAGTGGSFRGDNGGPLIVSKFRWTYSNPEGWNFFIYNNDAAALATGAVARMYATTYGVWV